MEGSSEIELKTLVARTLETKGVLNSIRAQLRAAVITAIDDQEKSSGVYLPNPGARVARKDEDGRLLSELISEYLEFYGLECSKSVFAPELDMANIQPSRQKLAQSAYCDETIKEPLLLQILRQHLNYKGTQPTPNVSESTSQSQLELVRKLTEDEKRLEIVNSKLRAMEEADTTGRIRQIKEIYNPEDDELLPDDDDDDDEALLSDDDHVDEDDEDDAELTINESDDFSIPTPVAPQPSSVPNRQNPPTFLDKGDVVVSDAYALDKYDFVEVIRAPVSKAGQSQSK